MNALRILPSRREGPGGGLLLFAMVVACLLYALGASTAAGQHFAEAEQAVEGGREALDRWQSFPWYDSENDTVRRIEVRPPPTPKAPPPTTTTPTSNSSWNADSIILWLGWTALAVLLTIVAVALIRTFLNREASAATATAPATSEAPAEIDRIEALPFKVERPLSNLLAEAQKHYRNGNFEQAIIYYYSYLLVELDKAHLIRLARGKTNRQYLRETRRATPLGDLVEATMVAFEEVFFGHHVLARTQFEQCWSQLGAFQDYIAEQTS